MAGCVAGAAAEAGGGTGAGWIEGAWGAAARAESPAARACAAATAAGERACAACGEKVRLRCPAKSIPLSVFEIFGSVAGVVAGAGLFKLLENAIPGFSLIAKAIPAALFLSFLAARSASILAWRISNSSWMVSCSGSSWIHSA